MSITHTLASDLSFLTHALQGPGADLETQIRGLAGSTRRAVDSYLGMRLTLVVEGHSVTVTAMDDPVPVGDILASARLPLAALCGAESGSVIVFYASRAGAFAEFAAELGFALGVRFDGVIVDDHLGARCVVSGLTGLRDMSHVNRAIGILIGYGRTPEGARTELRRLARLSEITLGPAARRLIQETGLSAARPELSSCGGGTDPRPQHRDQPVHPGVPWTA